MTKKAMVNVNNEVVEINSNKEVGLSFDDLNVLFPSLTYNSTEIYKAGKYTGHVESFEQGGGIIYNNGDVGKTYLKLNWRLENADEKLVYTFEQRIYEGFAESFCRSVRDSAEVAYLSNTRAELKKKMTEVLKGHKRFDLALTVKWLSSFDAKVELKHDSKYGWQLSIVNPYKEAK